MGTRERLELAEALIAKARATPYQAERTTFAASARQQIERFLAVDSHTLEVIDLRDLPAVVAARAASTYGSQMAPARPALGKRVDVAL
ncbi:MAG: hypothetical protein KGQ66_10780 [Acidobacteriota bacterium]|nr:hypothetical protein [Acidobacteriota bacterium]